MLAFIDSLCDALIARDARRIRILLAHPLARALPQTVRDEASAIADGTRRVVAPMHTLRLYHQTAHLLGTAVDPASGKSMERDADAWPQLELPIRHAVR